MVLNILKGKDIASQKMLELNNQKMI